MGWGSRSALAAAVLLVGSIAPGLAPGAAFAVSNTAVISQVYGGGGNTGAPFQNDYIELFNRGSTTVSLSGWSVQYASATGTGNFGASSSQITELLGTLAPGQHLLIQEGAGAGSGAPLPSPDIVDSTPIAMAATAGKVALVNTTTPLGCNGGSTPCPPSALAAIVDLVGYGGADFYEGAGPAPTLSNTSSALRGDSGCQDTDNNAADFTAGAPSPRNASTPLHPCGGDTAPTIASRSPASGATGVPVDSNVTITFSEPVNVSGTWLSLSCTVSGPHSATVAGGPTTFTIDPDADFVPNETCTVTVFAGQVSDQDAIDPPDNMPGNETWSFSTPFPSVRIHDIQGASHVSPLSGQNVSNVPGVVTAKRSNGYYAQDPSPDLNDATSEGIFVFTSSAAGAVNVGDSVKVSGTVSEFRPGGSTSTNLTTTEITSPTTTVLSSGNALPAATVVGLGGRVPPGETIEDDATGDVETSGTFDPASDGVDFYESLEGMRVQVNDAVAVGPTNAFGETAVLGDDGAAASVRTARGGIVVRPNDFNPERLITDDAIVSVPSLNVADHFGGTLVGVVDYSFGNFKLQLTTTPTAVHDGVSAERTTAARTNQVSIGTFNVENLDAADPPAKFDRLARLIVGNLRAPDILTLEEVQDNNGPVNDSVVNASLTLQRLVSAVQAAGGPTYDFRQIDPVDDQDGGEPGGNIRQAFFFRTDRGVSFVDRPGGSSTTVTTVVIGPDGPEFSSSPGRIDPANAAFNASRKPLAGEFLFNGHHLFMIGNHFNSKGGDQPLFGHLQPPARSSEVQRHAQAQVVHDFVASILAADPNANVVVDGDLNDFEFSDAVLTLEGGLLHDLIETLPQSERYSYVFEGNSQTLDHILVSGALAARPVSFDAVHVNAEFADQASDHDPSVVRITLNDAPTASAGGPYSVGEGGSTVLTATATDPEGGPFSFAWDLDGDGSFETGGQSVIFSAAGVDGPSSRTVAVTATDDGGLAATAVGTVEVTNVAPSVSTPSVSPEPSKEGGAVSASAAYGDPAPNDAPFTCTIDHGDGSGEVPGAVSPGTCTGPAHVYVRFGSYSVTVRVTDRDGGTGTSSATHTVVYDFSGFFEPVDSLPTLNSVRAGSAIPLRFSLEGDKGLSILAAGYPSSRQVLCSSIDPLDDIEETVTAGDSSLQYDPASDTYTYVWKTDRAWAATCRQLTVKLDDGTFHLANFRFT